MAGRGEKERRKELNGLDAALSAYVAPLWEGHDGALVAQSLIQVAARSLVFVATEGGTAPPREDDLLESGRALFAAQIDAALAAFGNGALIGGDDGEASG